MLDLEDEHCSDTRALLEICCAAIVIPISFYRPSYHLTSSNSIVIFEDFSQ